MVKCGNPVIIELGGDGAENRHIDGVFVEGLLIALDLFANVAHGIFAPAFLKFVDHHQVGKIEHIDFFQL